MIDALIESRIVATSRLVAAESHASVMLDADDLAQEGRLRVIRCRRLYRRELSSWPTYALLRAKGAMLDARRDGGPIKRLQQRELKSTGGIAPQTFTLVDDVISPVTHQCLPELSDLWEWVYSLVEPRAAWMLKRMYTHGWSVTQAGAHIGLQQANACRIIQLAMRVLRANREEYE